MDGRKRTDRLHGTWLHTFCIPLLGSHQLGEPWRRYHHLANLGVLQRTPRALGASHSDQFTCRLLEYVCTLFTHSWLLMTHAASSSLLAYCVTQFDPNPELGDFASAPFCDNLTPTQGFSLELASMVLATTAAATAMICWKTWYV